MVVVLSEEQRKRWFLGLLLVLIVILILELAVLFDAPKVALEEKMRLRNNLFFSFAELLDFDRILAQRSSASTLQILLRKWIERDISSDSLVRQRLLLFRFADFFLATLLNRLRWRWLYVARLLTEPVDVVRKAIVYIGSLMLVGLEEACVEWWQGAAELPRSTWWTKFTAENEKENRTQMLPVATYPTASESISNGVL